MPPLSRTFLRAHFFDLPPKKSAKFLVHPNFSAKMHPVFGAKKNPFRFVFLRGASLLLNPWPAATSKKLEAQKKRLRKCGCIFCTQCKLHYKSTFKTASPEKRNSENRMHFRLRIWGDLKEILQKKQEHTPVRGGRAPQFFASLKHIWRHFCLKIRVHECSRIWRHGAPPLKPGGPAPLSITTEKTVGPTGPWPREISDIALHARPPSQAKNAEKTKNLNFRA